tara:strand:+ start:173 stop:562 length:390 start_codon:yes stop_codon:yes gene_type:complete
LKYIEELKELAKLKDDGILTEDEFQKKKEEILSKSTPSKPIAKKASSKKTKKTATKKKDGLLTKALGSVMEGRLKKVEAIMKEGSPRLRKLAKQADESRQAFKKELEKNLKRQGTQKKRKDNPNIRTFR